mgnify:CR=1 FL=1
MEEMTYSVYRGSACHASGLTRQEAEAWASEHPIDGGSEWEICEDDGEAV